MALCKTRRRLAGSRLFRAPGEGESCVDAVVFVFLTRVMSAASRSFVNLCRGLSSFLRLTKRQGACSGLTEGVCVTAFVSDGGSGVARGCVVGATRPRLLSEAAACGGGDGSGMPLVELRKGSSACVFLFLRDLAGQNFSISRELRQPFETGSRALTCPASRGAAASVDDGQRGLPLRLVTAAVAVKRRTACRINSSSSASSLPASAWLPLRSAEAEVLFAGISCVTAREGGSEGVHCRFDGVSFGVAEEGVPLTVSRLGCCRCNAVRLSSPQRGVLEGLPGISELGRRGTSPLSPSNSLPQG